MLVECPECQIQFSPSLDVCPQCRWRPPLEKIRDYCVHDAALAISEGGTAIQIREDLLQRGFVDTDIDAILSEAQKRDRSSNRELGKDRIVKGVGLMCLSGLGYFFTLGTVFFYGLLAVGIGMFAAGLYQRVFGAKVD